MSRLLGDEAQLLEQSLGGEASSGLRANTLKVPPELLPGLVPWNLEPVPWCPAGYALPATSAQASPRPGLHPFHAAGLYYLQEPSAMAVAQLLAPLPGERVLDLAAAPGGKSTHLAAMLGGEGLLVANDVHVGRARELSRNMERWGARNVVITSETISQLETCWAESFDAVLLDAPCSGEGMFRKTPEASRQWTPELVSNCASRQEELLSLAGRLVRPGGRLVYSTCTFEPAENEEVVARFLADEPRWEIGYGRIPGVERGKPEWAGDSERTPELSGTIRLWPHLQRGEGHFAALLHKRHDGDELHLPVRSAHSFEAPESPRSRSRRSDRQQRAEGHETERARESWREFKAENLSMDPVPQHDLCLRRDGLYACPPNCPPLAGIRVLRPGLWLGAVERNRFLPSHALALALRPDESLRTLDLEPDSPELAAYLAGAELESSGDDGWLLITVGGYVLGWGRRGRDIVKNHYPKGLRRT